METRDLSSDSHLLALASLGLACLTENKASLLSEASVESNEVISCFSFLGLSEAFGSKSLKIVGSSGIAWNFQQTADVIGYLK